MPTIKAGPLQDFVAQLWIGLGAPTDDAATVAAALVNANLAGHDSHGVIRVPQWVEHLKDGRLQPGGRIIIAAEMPGTAVLDGGWNFGAVVARSAVRIGIEKARAVGVAAIAIRRSHHIGRLADTCRQAAEAGFVSALVANNHGIAAAVAPWGGTARRLSTNPMAYGFPRRTAPPILVDVTTAAAPEGKIRVLRNAGRPAPPGWLLDHRGEATGDPNTFYDEPRGSIRPLGGDDGHKGYGLSVAVDLLAGALSHAGCSSPDPVHVYGNAATLTLYALEAFGDPEAYYTRVEQLVDNLKSSPRRAGTDSILLPGEPEENCRRSRSSSGVTVDQPTWQALGELADELGLVRPATHPT